MSLGKRTGYASLPLHGGKAPAWLFSRMVLLSREILAHIEESRADCLDRLVYDQPIEVLSRAVGRARIDRTERVNALKRLAKICEARETEGSRTIPGVV